MCATPRRACKPRITSCMGCEASTTSRMTYSKRLTLALMCSTSFIQSISVTSWARSWVCHADLREPSHIAFCPRLQSQWWTLTCTERNLVRQCRCTQLILLAASRCRTRSRKFSRSLHREPTLRSDHRTGDCALASKRPAGPSSRGRRASSEPGSAPPHRT